MAINLDELNKSLIGELAQPLRIGIGIHVGPAIVGEMGYGPATGLTAIGDTVNIASRLEAMTKELGTVLIVTSEVCRYTDDAQLASSPQLIQVSGRDQPVTVHLVDDPKTLEIE